MSSARQAAASPCSGTAGRHGYALLAICWGGMFLYACFFCGISILLPVIAKAYGANAAVLGRILFSAFVGFTAGVLVCGDVSDRVGRKPVVASGMALFAVGLALFGAAGGFTGLVVASGLVGLGTSAVLTAGSALAAELFPRRPAIPVNVLQVAYGTGAIVSPLGARALVSAGLGCREFGLGLAGATALLTVLLLPLRVPAYAHTPRRSPPLALLSHPRRKQLAALMLAHALYVGGEVGLFTWIPTWFAADMPGGAAWAGAAASLYWVAVTAGRMAVTALSVRFAPAAINVGLASGASLCTVVLLLCRTPALATAVIVVAGCWFSGIAGMNIAQAGSRFPRSAGTALGWVAAAGGIGGAVLPWVVGALSLSRAGWTGGLALVPAAMLGVALVSAWLRGQEEERAGRCG